MVTAASICCKYLSIIHLEIYPSQSLPTNFAEEPFELSASTGINGDQSDNSAAAGAVYVFRRTNNSWAQEAYIKASNAEDGDQFGAEISLSKDILLVGAPEEKSNAFGINGNQSNNSKESAGAAYVFRRYGTTWSQQSYLKASNPDSFDRFGTSVGVSCGRVIIGAPLESSDSTGIDGAQTNNPNTSGSGAAYMFHIPELNFEDFMAATGTNGDHATFASDADADGLENGLEWILGSSATDPASIAMPSLNLTASDFEITLSRDDDAECATQLDVEWSSDLITWESSTVPSLSAQSITVTENNSSPDVVVVRLPRSFSINGRLFTRLKLSPRSCTSE